MYCGDCGTITVVVVTISTAMGSVDSEASIHISTAVMSSSTAQNQDVLNVSDQRPNFVGF